MRERKGGGGGGSEIEGGRVRVGERGGRGSELCTVPFFHSTTGLPDRER